MAERRISTKSRLPTLLCFLLAILLLGLPASSGAGRAAELDEWGDAARIRPYVNNPSYWQYKGMPVLLVGGSSNDNLFQNRNVIEELDRLKSYGGNYVRNTMSARDEDDLQAFHRDPASGRYDLSRWNDEYWSTLDHFLKATHEREIMVQLEIWATYDFYTRESTIIDGLAAWQRNPWNSANNINYTDRESGLYSRFESTHGTLINPFFMTVLPLSRPYDFNVKPLLLGFQQRFVDKLLSVTLDYDHILYVIDNETNTDPAWPIYWSQYIRGKAAERNLRIEVTEMWDSFDPTDGAVKGARVQNPTTHFFSRRANVSNTLKDPENFSYIEVSNHNFQQGEVHYWTGYYVWNEIRRSGIIRPVNNTKIYGSNQVGWTGSDRDGLERFWRNIFAGHASVRFHRPEHGLGHSEIAMRHVRSMRMFADRVSIARLLPRMDLLVERGENGAYCLAEEGRTYALVFMNGGRVRLDVTGLGARRATLAWLDVPGNAWREEGAVPRAGDAMTLQAPGDGFWLALVTVVE